MIHDHRVRGYQHALALERLRHEYRRKGDGLKESTSHRTVTVRVMVLLYDPSAWAAAGVTVPPMKTLIVVLLTMLNV
jgi:hypothetical protein